MYIKYNANPRHARVGDCTVRAISKALDQDWDTTYIEMCIQGLLDKDMPSANAVWGNYLKTKGFKRKIIPNECPECYTVEDFCKDHPTGNFILALSGHVICARDGNFYDTWQSGAETPVYYWERE